ncbi:MAG: hypothetical protein K8J08_15230 [Thermoanaerobaculia bacterium]|nr:hypothetical protein [Thermoanaerobaculia bacterium]
MTRNEPTVPSRTRWLLLITPFLPLLTALPGGAWLLPFIAPWPLYPVFVTSVRSRRWSVAWLDAMAWTVLLSAGVIFLTLTSPEIAREGILRGDSYREEMFGWIWTGVGREVTPSAFLPEHALHLVAFVALTWLSGGYLGLVLGAFLVAYMSYFVGCYAAESGHVVLGSVFAWVPWSVVRVASFIMLGALFSRPLWTRTVWPFSRRDLRFLLLALAGIAADVSLKILLAPAYGHFLRRLAGS